MSIKWSLVMQSNTKPKSDSDDDEWDSHVLSVNGVAWWWHPETPKTKQKNVMWKLESTNKLWEFKHWVTLFIWLCTRWESQFITPLNPSRGLSWFCFCEFCNHQQHTKQSKHTVARRRRRRRRRWGVHTHTHTHTPQKTS